MAEITLEKQKTFDKIQANAEIYQRNLQLLEKKLKTVEKELEETKVSLIEVKAEYDNYKHKAQNAFKRQKEQSENSSAPNSNETQKILNDLEQFRQMVKISNEKKEELTERVRLLEKENELMQEEYAAALDRNTKLLTELKEKETEWKNK